MGGTFAASSRRSPDRFARGGLHGGHHRGGLARLRRAAGAAGGVERGRVRRGRARGDADRRPAAPAAIVRRPADRRVARAARGARADRAGLRQPAAGRCRLPTRRRPDAAAVDAARALRHRAGARRVRRSPAAAARSDPGRQARRGDLAAAARRTAAHRGLPRRWPTGAAARRSSAGALPRRHARLLRGHGHRDGARPRVHRRRIARQRRGWRL